VCERRQCKGKMTNVMARKRTICDFADEKKKDDYQGYVSFTSAQAL